MISRGTRGPLRSSFRFWQDSLLRLRSLWLGSFQAPGGHPEASPRAPLRAWRLASAGPAENAPVCHTRHHRAIFHHTPRSQLHPGRVCWGVGVLGGQLRIQVTVERCHETPTGGARIPVGGGEKATQICPRDAVICAEPEAEQTNSEPHRERRGPPEGGVCSISTGQRGHWAHWGTQRVERGSA